MCNMSVEKLKEEILKETEKVIKEIIDNAEKEAKKIIEAANEKAKSIVETKKQEIIKKLSEKEKAILALAKLEGKRLILEMETKLLNETVKRAVDKLSKIKRDEKYLEFLAKLTIEAMDYIGSSEVSIQLNDVDKGFLSSNWSKFVSKIKAKYPNVNLNIDNRTVKILGGVILQSKDRTKIYNNSIDAKLNRIIEEERGNIISILMGE